MVAGCSTVFARFVARLRPLWPVARWGLFAGGLAYCLLAVAGVVYDQGSAPVMRDAASYYYADTPYDWTDDPAGVGEYRYAPLFLVVIAPVRLLPWELFAAVWFAAHIGVLLYLRLPWMLAFPGVIDDVVRGNVVTFMALAAVLVVRHGMAPLWASYFLTKVIPGVTIVWHAARREWRAFVIGLGVTAALVGGGWLVNPQLWEAWFDTLLASQETYPQFAVTAPVWLRVVGGVAISLYAGLTGRAWLLPIGILVAMPGWWPYSFAILVASVVLIRPTAPTEVVNVVVAPSSDCHSVAR